MKKNLINTLAFAAVISLISSCAKEENNPVVEQGKQITISASFPEDATKVVFTGSDEKNPIALKWEVGDVITITATDNPSNKQTFTLASGAGTNQATFTGTALAPAASYKISYGSDGSYAVQTQAKDGDASHVNYKATLSGVTDYTNFTFSKVWATANGATYTPSAVLRLRAKIPNSDPDLFGAVKAVVFKASAPIFNEGTEMKVNITNSVDDEELDYLTIYASLPGEQAIAAGTKLWISFQTDADKAYKKYTAYRELGSTPIKAGQVNTLSLDCTNIDKFAGKEDDGTSAHPYLIADQNQMAAMKDNIVADAITYFKMVDDVDMNGIAWTPFNYSGSYNKGVYFDGQTHTISNFKATNATGYPSFAGVLYGTIKDVTFESPVIDGGSNNMGVIGGYIGSGDYDGICEGIIVNNATVIANTTGSKGRNAGGFAGVIGTAGSSITNCHVTGTTSITQNSNVNGSSAAGFIANVNAAATISGCTATANVENTGSYYTAGFIGQIGSAVAANISDCAFLGGNLVGGRNATANSPIAGFIARIAGGSATTITNCYVDGAHISAVKSGRCGGFVGDSGSNATIPTFTSCYVKNSSISAAQHCGGFAGVFYASANKCYVESTAITSNDSNNGGFVGYLENAIITNCYAIATVSGGSCANVGGFVGNSRAGAIRSVTVTNCFENSTVTGTGTGVGAFLVG